MLEIAYKFSVIIPVNEYDFEIGLLMCKIIGKIETRIQIHTKCEILSVESMDEKSN
jgi:hypothetical protein